MLLHYLALARTIFAILDLIINVLVMILRR
jgi:hypothetical protein